MEALIRILEKPETAFGLGLLLLQLALPFAGIAWLVLHYRAHRKDKDGRR